MEQKQCPFCAEEIKPEAIKCKHCGSNLRINEVTDPNTGAVTQFVPVSKGTLWLPVPSLVLSILAVLALFDDSGWDMDLLYGLFLFTGTGLVMGIISVLTQRKGRGMAIAGIVLSSLGMLAGFGLLAGM